VLVGPLGACHKGQFGSERRIAAQWSGFDAFSAKHFVLPVCDH
jgi:hypothetical protein